MADDAALREAKALVSLANSVQAKLDAEIAALEQAQRLAREAVARLDATAAAGVDLAGTLGGGLRQGRELQDEAMANLDEGARLQAFVWEAAFPIAFGELSALASAGLQPARPFLPTPAPLPDFATPTREELWQGELARSRHAAVWDVLAEDVKTFRELQEEALARLAAAEQELEQAEEKTHRRKAPDRTGREEREHE